MIVRRTQYIRTGAKAARWLDAMNQRILIVILLLGVPLLPISSVPLANSQTTGTSTTMTISQPLSQGQCSILTLAFSAHAGDQIIGTYGSDTSIDFYILSWNDLNAIQNCRLAPSVRPFFIEENSVGHNNPFRSLSFPVNGTYYFVFLFVRGLTQLTKGYASVELSFPASITIVNSTTSSTSTIATTVILLHSSSSSTSMSSSSSSVASQAQSPGAIGNLGTGGAIALTAIIAMVGSVMVVMRRKKTSMNNATTAKLPQEAEFVSQPVLSDRLSTGYADLDSLLVGGLPRGYAILLLSPPCDERDLLLRKIIGSALSAAMPTFYLSNDLSKTQDLVRTYSKDFIALSPQMDKILSPPANLYTIPSIDNLNDINIAFTKIMTERANEGTNNRFIIFDLLTDILLLHKGVTARKWFSDFVARRKVEGFTVLAFLNPLVASTEETQTLIDLFDGVIEIYEKELRERSRRFLVIKRMYGQRYSESELMLDKNKLF